MKKANLIILMLLGLAFFSCSAEDSKEEEDAKDLNYSGDCEKSVIIDRQMFTGIRSQYHDILKAEINGDCLVLEIYSNGCDGSNWKVDLIDSSDIMESNPIQRQLKVKLVSGEDCTAMVKKQYSFDLSALQISDDKISLNLENWEKPLLYSY